MVVIRILGDGPTIEHLLHHKKPHAIGEVEELWCGRIMRGANCVDAELAQLSQSAFPHRERDSGANCTSVRVQRHAIDFVMDSIDEKSLVGIEVECANSEGYVLLIDRLAVTQQCCMNGIDSRVIEIPEIGFGQRSLGIEIGSS